MKMEYVSAGLTGLLLAALLVIFRSNLSEAVSFAPLALFMGMLPYLAHRYIRYNEIKAIEKEFPEFLRSLAEAQRSGIALPQAIVNATKIDYGPLSKEIKRMAAQITWGVPFPKVLRMFSNRVKESNFLRRSIAVILEAYRSGGDIAEVMNSVAESARMIKELEAERKSRFNQQLMIMYAIYFIFLIIIIALNKILTPMFAMSSTQEIGGLSLGGGGLDPGFYRTIFLHMILMQAIFSGLLAGQVGEGSLIAGVKHSLILLTLGSLIFMLFLPKQTVLIEITSPYDVFAPGSAYELTGSVVTPQKMPVSDADIKIEINGKTYLTKTDPLGTFSQKLLLPSSPGSYTITVEASAKSGKGKATTEVVVS